MWYEKYLKIYNCPIKSVPSEVIDEIRDNYKQKTSDSPVASVVAIAHNEEERILACLWSLIDNVCKYPIEIYVVNDDSEDNLSKMLFSMGVTMIFEERRSPGYARQAGLNFAHGKYFICIDSDTLYPPHYIETMIDALHDERYSCAYGLWSFLPDKNLSSLKIRVYELFRDIYLYLQHLKRPELNVRGMVFAFRTELARKYGFRKDIIRGEDGSLAFNLKQDGKIRFVRSRHARPITDNSILKAKGSLTSATLLRFRKGLRGFLGLFTSKKYYDDQEENLII